MLPIFPTPVAAAWMCAIISSHIWQEEEQCMSEVQAMFTLIITCCTPPERCLYRQVRLQVAMPPWTHGATLRLPIRIQLFIVLHLAVQQILHLISTILMCGRFMAAVNRSLAIITISIIIQDRQQ